MRRELSKDAAALEGSSSELAEIRVDAEQGSRIGTQLKRAAAREHNRRRQSIAELMAAQQVIVPCWTLCCCQNPFVIELTTVANAIRTQQRRSVCCRRWATV